ncbi:MAG TPA: MFS transporter [Burkholderiales bacterium]|nr:MFS transporter [Burkholderiales bacterium]
MTARRKRALLTCSAVHIVHDGLADLTYVLLPLLAQAFGLSLAQVGLIRGAHRTAMAALQVPAGLLAERVGERNLLALGTMVTGVAFVALGHASGFFAILAALFLAGVGSSVQHPVASTILSRAYAADGRRAALGTYNFAGDVGKFSFGAMVSLALLAGIGWQAPVVAFGVVALLASGAVLAFIAIPRLQASSFPLALTPGGAGWGIRDRRGFTVLCLIEILDSSTRAGFLTFVAFLLISAGLAEGWAASAVPLVFIGGMAGKYACGVLAERLGVVRMIVVTELLTAGGILAVIFLPPMVAFLILPLLGVVLQGTSSVLYATVGEFVEQDRLPRSFGLFYTVGSVCGIAAPLGFGLLGDRFGVTVAMATMGALVLLTLPLAALLKARYAAARLSCAAE